MFFVYQSLPLLRNREDMKEWGVDRQTDRQTERQAGRQTGRETKEKENKGAK